MKLRMLEDRVVVKIDPSPRFTEGGVALPEFLAPERPLRATVVAVGPGVVSGKTGCHKPLDVKEGDRVFLGNYQGIEIEVDGEKLHIVRQANIDGHLVGDA